MCNIPGYITGGRCQGVSDHWSYNGLLASEQQLRTEKGLRSILLCLCLFPTGSVKMVRRRPLPPPGVGRKRLGASRTPGQGLWETGQQSQQGADGLWVCPPAGDGACAQRCFKHSAHVQLQRWLRQRGLQVQRGEEKGGGVSKEESCSPSSLGFGERPLKRESI